MAQGPKTKILSSVNWLLYMPISVFEAGIPSKDIEIPFWGPSKDKKVLSDRIIERIRSSQLLKHQEYPNSDNTFQ